MSTKCAICDNLAEKDILKCKKCQRNFHHSCLEIPKADFDKILPMNKIKWLCPECKVKKNEPVQLTSNSSPHFLNSPLQDKPSSMVNLDSQAFTDYFNKLFATQREDWKQDMKIIVERLDKWENKLTSLETRLTAVEGNITIISEENKSLLSVLQCRDHEIESLKNTISQLEDDRDSQNEKSVMKEIEISGIPENKSENLIHIFRTTAMKLGLQLDDKDIDYARRVGPYKNDRKTPRLTVIGLTRRTLKSDIIKAARVRRGLTSQDIEVTGNLTNIYINERLTKKKRLLFIQARRLQKENEFKFCWTRDGKINVRKTEFSKVEHITNETDLVRVFEGKYSSEISK